MRLQSSRHSYFQSRGLRLFIGDVALPENQSRAPVRYDSSGPGKLAGQLPPMQFTLLVHAPENLII
jgi:hypothetical protein